MDIHKVIGKLPKPKKGFVLPNHMYAGPWNHQQQLDEKDQPVVGQESYNVVDANCYMRHGICYRDHEAVKVGKHKCDNKMIFG